MSSISIIGSGNMASAIGALALKGGNTVEIIGRDTAKAAALASALGTGATAGDLGRHPSRRHRHPRSAFRQRRADRQPVRGRAGRQDHRRHHQPLQPQRSPGWPSLTTPPSRNWSPRPPPASAHVVKAFNTLFRDVLAAGGPLDVFIAGDDAQAKVSVSAFIGSLGLRPQDTGDLSMAHWLEGAGLLSVGLARHGVGDLNFSLGVNVG